MRTSSAATARATSCWRPPGASISTRWWPRPPGLRSLGAGQCGPARAAGNASCRLPYAASESTATQQYMLQLARGPAARDADRYAAKLLAMVLGDDSGSRLYWELVDPGLAENAEMNHYEYEGAGVFLTGMSCMPDETADNLQRILDVYRQAEAEGITQAEFDQAKSKVRSRIVLSGERPRGRLFSVGSDWVYRGEYRSIDEDLAAVAAITVDDAAAVLAKYPISRGTTMTVGPLAEVRTPR